MGGIVHCWTAIIPLDMATITWNELVLKWE
jgi:hypothetical protein